MTELSASAGSEGYAACDDDGGVFAFAAGRSERDCAYCAGVL